MPQPTTEEINALADLFERADHVTLGRQVNGEPKLIGLGTDMRQLIANALRTWAWITNVPEYNATVKARKEAQDANK